jgi:DNA-binding response OmpR family regulator/nitrogen-specific signal transduction histidine kinase
MWKSKKNRLYERQAEKLKEIDRVKSRFFTNITHEFRTTLTLIMGPLEQMLSKSGKKKDQEILGMMLRNSRRLLDLINRLLELSRFESGKVMLQASLQDMIPFVKGIVASFSPLVRQKGIQLEFAAEEERIELYFDDKKMEEALYNLLSNAVKFTPSGGRIIVSLKMGKADGLDSICGSGFLEISVMDSGVGISGEQLPHIFERFYQVEDTSAREGNQTGTGVGLSLTREIVNHHHGKIEVRSSVGKNSGTTFIICLPLGKDHLKPGEIEASTTESLEPGNIQSSGNDWTPRCLGDESENWKILTAMPGSGTSGGRQGSAKEDEPGGKNVILLVDDNADLRRYIRESLEPEYSVIEAVDGNEGMQRAKSLIPDLIVSDIMMLGMNGFELCRAVKKNLHTSHIPVILLTAKAGEESMARGLETGADDYVTKPFSTKLLNLRIKNLIDLRRQLQLVFQRRLNLQPEEITVSSIDQKFITEVQEVIEKNLSNDLFNVDQLAKKLYVSRATLYRKINALTGLCPREFIKSYRLKRGAQLLKANFGNVTEVANEVGFSSSAYFSTCFKEKFHQQPSDFLETNRQK